MATTTTMSSEVPPKTNGTLPTISTTRQQADAGDERRAPQREPREHLVDVFAGSRRPGRISG